MSELPDRPDLDQLRRQARELLRAATDGEPHALARIHAVSERMTLSAAQLALAREYGFPSWPALRTGAEQRRRMSETPASPRREGYRPVQAAIDRWSFGGASTIQTAAGVLSPGALVIGPDHAALDGSLMPSPETQQRLARPRRQKVPGCDSPRPFWAGARPRLRCRDSMTLWSPMTGAPDTPSGSSLGRSRAGNRERSAGRWNCASGSIRSQRASPVGSNCAARTGQ